MSVITSNWNETVGALSSLSTQIQTHLPDGATFLEHWGWQQPAVTRQDLIDKVQTAIDRINACKECDVPDQVLINRVTQLPQTINYVSSNTIPNSGGGNAYLGYATIVSLLDSIIAITDRVNPRDLGWDEIQDRKLVPAQLKKRIDTLSLAISAVEARHVDIADKMKVINEVHQAANSLPESLAGLEDAKNKYEQSKDELDKIKRDSEQIKISIDDHKDKIEKSVFKVHEMTKEIEEIKSAVFRHGLGSSFDDRAKNLRMSTYILMFLLAVSLFFAAKISHDRVLFVENLLKEPNLDLQILWANVVLTGFGVAAPIWFAWLLTKQIGQRFRLAEDYGFKASVAKAYEGYRRETQEIGDPELQRRLLSIALDKVEYPPLTHISKEDSSSPFHDLISAVVKRRDD